MASTDLTVRLPRIEHPTYTTVWSIRELNHLFETHGGTVAMQSDGDTSLIVVTLTMPDGRREQTEWEPAFHPFGFGLPIIRAFYFGTASVEAVA